MPKVRGGLRERGCGVSVPLRTDTRQGVGMRELRTLQQPELDIRQALKDRVRWSWQEKRKCWMYAIGIRQGLHPGIRSADEEIAFIHSVQDKWMGSWE